jgi:L-ascorbate 6-phosphate lactonase
MQERPNEIKQPILQGQALLDDISSASPAPGEVCLWWLGQSGFAIKTASILFYIDLYLSEALTENAGDEDVDHSRLTAAPLRGGDITNAEWVFISHEHPDHFDGETLTDLFKASPQAKLILPAYMKQQALDLGLSEDRLITTDGHEAFTAGPMTVHSVPASHPDLEQSEQAGYRYVGYVFEVDGVRLYHSGDTILYDGLIDRLKGLNPQVALLPINGTDSERLQNDIAPNMGIPDAVYVGKAIGAELVIPHHYDLFAFNTADEAAFISHAEAQQLPYQILCAGERFTWRTTN